VSEDRTPVPALTKPGKQRKLSTTERVTASGLRIVAVRKPGVPLVEVRLRIPALSSRPTQPARTALLSDSVLTGAGGYDRAGLAAAVQALGGDLGVGVDADRLIFSGNVLATNLKPLLTLLGTVLTEPTYPAAEVNAERDRLIEKLTIARSRAGVVAGEALARRLWGNHPYARDLPEIADVRGATAAQVRKIHTELVRPEGAVLVVVGDITPNRALDQIEAALADWTGAPATGRVSQLPAIDPGPPVLVDRPGSVQSSIRLGGAARRRDDPQYPALQLANLIFGGYFSSRWNENIREDKGYTYGPRSHIEHNALGSVLLMEADVATEVTGPALLETFYELGKIASLPVTEAELASVRQYAIGTLALSTATQAGLASTLVALVAAGLDENWLVEHPQRLARVGIDEVSAAATQFFAPSGLVSVVVGDAGQVAPQLGVLGPVVTADAL
jgi:predicted Zn-dependent peptidase